MSLSKKVFSNTFWQVFGRLFTALVGVVSIKLITSAMPTQVYGMYTTLFELIGFFAIIADFGLYTICVQQMAEKKHSNEHILGNVLTIRLFLIILTLGVASVAIPLIPKYNDTLIAKNAGLVALVTSLALCSGTISALLQYRLKMIWFSVAQILGKLTTVSFIFYVVKILPFNNVEVLFSRLIYSAVIGNLLMLVLTYVFVSKIIPVRLKVDIPYIKSIMKNALPYGLALILNKLYFKIDIVFIQWISGSAEAGIYAVSLKIMEIIAVIPVFFMNSALPDLTDSFYNNKKRFYEIVDKSFKYLSLLGAPIMIGGMVLAFGLTFIISSPQYLSGFHCKNDIREVFSSQTQAALNCPNIAFDPVFKGDFPDLFQYTYGSDMALKIVLVAIFLVFLNSLFGFCLVAMGKQSKLLRINALCLTFNVVTNLLLIPKFGFLGAALTTVLSEFLILYGAYFYVKRESGYTQDFSELINIIALSVAMGVVVHFLFRFLYTYVQNFAVLLAILGGVTFYAYTSQKIGLLNLKEFKKSN